mmetsp:Transcript_26754/g.62537  ORF Transcript_26754/g.62537 Transcript_26754/m.62537 type:complete len:525 (+) Transcript_26754:143-1717(+)
MGNLLSAPVTEKETHQGVTKDEQLKFGLSSMQGWRVHMEDAHIAEGDLYALDASGNGTSTKISLPGHALFAVYDGHGGTFAAIYSGNNFLRILSKQTKFVRYAKMCHEDTEASGDGQASTATPSKTKASRAAKKMELLEQALKQAFVETDYEIGLAIRGKSHADANSPYHDPPKDAASSDGATGSTGDSNDNHTSGNDHHGPTMEGAAMKAASDHVSAINDDGNSGTTSCVVMITPESIVCANAGDSRAVFARRPLESTGAGSGSGVGKAIPLSFDHKPDDEEEERRVRCAGGYVAGGRVEGDLAVSRGLGDFRFKQMAVVLNNTQLYPEESDETAAGGSKPAGDTMDTTDDEGDGNDQTSNNGGRRVPLPFSPGDQKVSPIPDVIVHARNAERDEYVVVACDGIWDVVSNQQCIAELDQIMYDEGERELGLVAEEILDTCLQYGSKDNMTVIVVQLPGCEKSYTDVAAKAKSDSTSSVEGDEEPPQPQREGVVGRRRKREERQQRQREDDDDEGGESPLAAPL